MFIVGFFVGRKYHLWSSFNGQVLWKVVTFREQHLFSMADCVSVWARTMFAEEYKASKNGVNYVRLDDNRL
jgi:hypothetical protein